MTAGTVHRTCTPLRKWFAAAWLIGQDKRGQLGTKAGVLLDGAGPGIADLHTMRFLYHMSVMIV